MTNFAISSELSIQGICQRVNAGINALSGRNKINLGEEVSLYIYIYIYIYIQSNLDNSKCQGSQEFLRIIGSSNFRNRQFSDMFGYFYSMSLYDDYCNLISALWVSNGNICQSIKENALPEGCSHRLLRLTCLRKQEKKKRKPELTFLFTAINNYENEG